MTDILIINGPNLNMLGRRDESHYGSLTMEQILDALRTLYKDRVSISYFQSNSEGALIDRIQQAGFGKNPSDGIVINAGAYTHTSLALADAIADCPVPVVEVHLSNVASREPIRRTSLIGPVCMGSIAGFRSDVYRLGIEALLFKLDFNDLPF